MMSPMRGPTRCSAVFVLWSLLVRSCDAAGSKPVSAPGPSEPRRARIAVIPKGTTHVFWSAVEAGAREGAAEAGVEIVWKGPLQESDRAQQIQLVQQFVSDGVDGI